MGVQLIDCDRSRGAGDSRDPERGHRALDGPLRLSAADDGDDGRLVRRQGERAVSGDRRGRRAQPSARLRLVWPVQAWPAYKYSVEHSVYVDKDCRGRGRRQAAARRRSSTRARVQQYHNVIGGIDADQRRQHRASHAIRVRVLRPGQTRRLQVRPLAGSRFLPVDSRHARRNPWTDDARAASTRRRGVRARSCCQAAGATTPVEAGLQAAPGAEPPRPACAVVPARDAAAGHVRRRVVAAGTHPRQLRLADVGAHRRRRSDAELGRAYGQVGKLLLAAELYDQAEPHLLNARGARACAIWPGRTYLAHAYRLKFQADKAIAALRRSHFASSPTTCPRWSGWESCTSMAAAPISRSRCSPRPSRSSRDSAAALFELGKAALASGDSARAVTQLEAALAADPGADGVHYALAMAYRARGDEPRAAAHVRLWKDERLYPADPLMAEITDLLKTAVVFEIRGTQAMDDRKWAEAAALFREGLKVAPRDATLHQNLGTALVSRRRSTRRRGRVRGGRASAARLREGALQPWCADGGARPRRDAIDRFSQGGRLRSDDGERARESRRCAAPHRQARRGDRRIRGRSSRSDPSASQARFGHAMALVRLRRFAEARAVLEEAVRAHPEQPGLAHALARILAVAPDDAVRDGPRALRSASLRSNETTPTLAIVETSAMALAENGRFNDAVARQRQAIAMATQAAPRDLADASRGESPPLRGEHALAHAVGR